MVGGGLSQTDLDFRGRLRRLITFLISRTKSNLGGGETGVNEVLKAATVISWKDKSETLCFCRAWEAG